MKESDLKLFLDVSLHFFEKMTGQRPESLKPLISMGFSKFHQFHGWIEVSGAGRGVVCVSISEELADKMLQCQGETLNDEAMRLDIAGEAASIIASNAREYFGQDFLISPPQSSSLKRDIDNEWPYPRFCLPVLWQGHEAAVILAFEALSPAEA